MSRRGYKQTEEHKKKIAVSKYGNKYNLKIPPKKLKLDKNLAYILGVIKGDGCVQKYQTDLGVIDKDFALAFRKALEEWSGMKASFHIYKEYYVILNSKYVSSYLKNFDINKIKSSPKTFKAAFLKGMYDSEGCAIPINKEINICGQNKQLLQFCKDLLLDLGIESRPIRICIKKGTIITFPNNSTYVTKLNDYDFNISIKKNLVKFKNLVDFNIKRKRYKLKEMINSYLTKRQMSFMKSLPKYERKNWKRLWRKKYG